MFGITARDIAGFGLAIIAGTLVFMIAGPSIGGRVLWGGLTLAAGMLLVMIRIPPDFVPLEVALWRRARAIRRPRRYVFRAPLPEPEAPPEPPASPPAPSPAPTPAPAPVPAPSIPHLALGPVRILVPAEAVFWTVALTGLIWAALSLAAIRLPASLSLLQP